MDQHYFDNTTKAGTTTGTVLIILANINSANLIKTGILAAVGAIVSFCISTVLKLLIKILKNQRWQKW